MTLLKITFDFGSILLFIIGIFTGFFLMLLFYLYAVIRGMNKKIIKHKTEEINIDEEEIKLLINDAKEDYKNKDARKELGTFKHLIEVNKMLANDIASKFYPSSKYPYLELTIDEVISLSHYITNRVDELFESKILNLFRKITLRKIIELNDTKKSIEENKLVKSVKKYNVVSAVKFTLKTLNLLNPFYWIRTLTVNQVTNIVLSKMGQQIIQITGEETYKIYSKKVFDVEVDLESDLDEIYEELEKELKEEGRKSGEKK